MPITVEAKESAGLDAGAYEGDIVDLIEETGDFGDQIKFVLRVDDLFQANGEPVQQWAWASKTLSPKSKLWKWIKNVTGITPQIGASFDVSDTLLNQHVGFLVSINENGRSVVTDIFRPKAVAKAPTPIAKKAAPGQAQPQAAGSDTCDVEGCDEPLDHYTKKGKALCANHDAEDL